MSSSLLCRLPILYLWKKSQQISECEHMPEDQMKTIGGYLSNLHVTNLICFPELMFLRCVCLITREDMFCWIGWAPFLSASLASFSREILSPAVLLRPFKPSMTGCISQLDLKAWQSLPPLSASNKRYRIDLKNRGWKAVGHSCSLRGYSFEWLESHCESTFNIVR